MSASVQRSEEEQQELNDLVSKFNFVIMGMLTHITEYHCDPGMSGMKYIFEKIIEESPEEPISCFLINVYSNDNYRLNILKQNDKFFMDEQYENVINGDRDKVAKLFEFRNLWKKIHDDTRCFIKKSMSALVKISQKYVLVAY